MNHHEQLTFFFNGQFPKSDTRTFIKYIGSKKTVRHTIFSVFPDDMTELVSLFIGSGGFELYAAANGVRVYGYDKFNLLVRLWNIMLTPEKVPLVAQRVDDIFPIADTNYLSDLIKTDKIRQIEDDIEFASLAICMARQTFNAYFLNQTYFRDSENRHMKNKKLVKGSLMNVSDWNDWQSPNLTVSCKDWKDSLVNHKDNILYCDPPYVDKRSQKYYGPYRTQKYHKLLVEEWNFDHVEFAEAMKTHNNGWAISYVDNPLLRELYQDYDVLFLEWARPMLVVHPQSSNKKEILILKPPCQHPLAIPYRNVKEEA